MHFGTATDEATSFAILDRYVEAGGTFVDTADNYGFWVGTQGGESEELLGRWRRSRDADDEIVIGSAWTGWIGLRGRLGTARVGLCAGLTG